MATVEEVAGLALSAVDVNAERPIGLPQVGKWVVERYRELVAKSRFRHLRRLGSLRLPAAISDGTVTVTNNSATVVLDADAQAAVTAAGLGASTLGTGDWFVRFSSSIWYPVSTYAAPNLTLGNVYTEETTVGNGWLLLKHLHPLAADARWLGKFVYPRRRRALEMRSLHMLDYSAPERQLTAAGPWYVAEATNVPSTTTDLGTAGRKRVELYPYSTVDDSVYYTYWALPSELGLTDSLPAEIDPYVLREGVLIDVYRYRASQMANAGNIEAAGYWRNESRAQATSWKDQLMDATKADRGQDDVSFILHATGLGGIDRRDIVTARDEVYARGNRP